MMIPHGHMLDYAEPVGKDEARQKLNIPEDKTIFLFFGQIKKVKGVDVLLRSVAKIHEQNAALYFVVAGSGRKTDFNVCEKIIKENHMEKSVRADIRYIPDEEVKYYYSACDVCVLLYTDVYQSGIIQLSYAYKKPVIASKLSAFTQFAKEDNTGFLAEPGNVDSLANAILRAAEKKTQLPEIGRKGYEMIKKKLGWGKIADEIIRKCYVVKGYNDAFSDKKNEEKKLRLVLLT